MNQYIDGDYVVTEYDSGAVVRELKFVPEAEAKPWTKKDFLLKFTPAEYAAIKTAAAANPTLDYYWTLFTMAQEVLKTDPVTIAGINLLEQAGLIAAGRATEILG